MPDAVGNATGVVIVAAGSGTRFGVQDKVFAPLASLPMVEHSLRVFLSHASVCEIVLVMGTHTLDRGRDLAARFGSRVQVAVGGATRLESVRAGVVALDATIGMIVIHDAARPLVTSALFNRLHDMATSTGAAVPVVQVADTIYVADAAGALDRVADRSVLRAAQTPQIARRDWLELALAGASVATDEGSLLHAAGYPVALVDGDPGNIKVTLPSDLILAEVILAARKEAV